MYNTFKPLTEGTISIYIHWPFCSKKCPYCDFNSYVSKEIQYHKWLEGYFNSIEQQMHFLKGKKIKSIFFGGGTPSLMPVDMLYQLISYFKKYNQTNFQTDISEITLESNPSTFEINKFKDFKNAGITRLSTGIQSFNDRNLKFLGRNHSVAEAIVALEESAKIFTRTSFDLIMGLPQQSTIQWQQELTFAMQFIGEHISIYQLTIEEGTPFYYKKIQSATEEIGEEIYTYTLAKLENIGLYAYEISNFAKQGCESIHNLNYWQGGEYIGIGPNAHGRVFYQGEWFATCEYKNPAIWLDKACSNENIFAEYTKLTNFERWQEIIMTSLRTKDPLHPDLLAPIEHNKIHSLIEQGLMLQQKDALYISKKGHLCLNYVIGQLLI